MILNPDRPQGPQTSPYFIPSGNLYASESTGVLLKPRIFGPIIDPTRFSTPSGSGGTSFWDDMIAQEEKRRLANVAAAQTLWGTQSKPKISSPRPDLTKKPAGTTQKTGPTPATDYTQLGKPYESKKSQAQKLKKIIIWGSILIIILGVASYFIRAKRIKKTR